MAMPRAWGGPELDPLTQIRIIEARHGRCRDDDRRGASRAWWLPRERAFSVCQRLPPLRMGGAGMHCFWGRRAAPWQQWRPRKRQCFLPLSECEIRDTWYTTGLCGTGSHDVAVRDLFVTEEHTFSLQDPRLVKRCGPLYTFPFMFIAKGPGTATPGRREADGLSEVKPAPALNAQAFGLAAPTLMSPISSRTPG